MVGATVTVAPDARCLVVPSLWWFSSWVGECQSNKFIWLLRISFVTNLIISSLRLQLRPLYRILWRISNFLPRIYHSGGMALSRCDYYECLEDVMTYRELYDAYLTTVAPRHTGSSIIGADRDAALLPLSCVPLLAYTSGGYSYPVAVLPSEYADGSPALHIVGTPGCWLLSTLLENGGHYPNGIAIDFGQGWYCTNFQQVLDAVVAREVLS